MTGGGVEGGAGHRRSRAATGEVSSTPADAYDRYIGRYSEQLARHFISAVGIRNGQSVLEVGCGPGALTGALVGMLGGERVCAVDPSEGYAEACRRRAPGAGVQVARAEALPFADRAFDVALAQLVVNLLERPETGVREMTRVTRPGGVAAAAVWADDGMTLLRAFWDSAAVVAPEAVSSVPESRRVGYRREQLVDLWTRARLTDPSLAALEATVAYADFDELWLPIETGVGKSGELCRSLDVTRREALRRELHRRLGAPASSFSLTARAWCVCGTVEA